jgi:hypothetical protein
MTLEKTFMVDPEKRGRISQRVETDQQFENTSGRVPQPRAKLNFRDPAPYFNVGLLRPSADRPPPTLKYGAGWRKLSFARGGWIGDATFSPKRADKVNSSRDYFMLRWLSKCGSHKSLFSAARL